MILFCAGPVTFVSSLVWGLGHRVGPFVPRALHTGPQLMVALSKATGAETLASQSREVELWGGFYVRLKKSAGPPQRLPWEDSETALGKPSQRKWCRERKNSGQPSLLFSFFSCILCFACLHIWSIWHLRLFARDLDEFCLWNSNGDGGYLWLIHTVFSCETLVYYLGQGAH